VANQAEQVRRFWEGNGSVIVIDRSIFDYFSEEQKHSRDEVEYHALFPKITTFKVAFEDAAIRDDFNARLKLLRESGEYRRILRIFHMQDLAAVCDGLRRSGPSESRPKAYLIAQTTGDIRSPLISLSVGFGAKWCQISCSWVQLGAV
jgi:hypothetical protein